ncbi:hypothetical protein EKO23_20300 [Nocardioides guangzhouensis]|uniref:Uncharacterized protein n=1 Tax=Nocardioides guangzhouensis TaxID=2497878 RepID=A0A4V1XYF5_9ACTN|nr:hypothetical protein [Nocardioides guangzhouensis]RYP83069.1 hypothetical protein EKO23_20300 [Nocardioides guangzhouensis]
MFESAEAQRRIGRFAWWMAWFGLVAGQLHALARFRTEDGKSDLDYPLTAAWAEPADKLLDPLLGWASPDVVYLTFGKIWLPVFVAYTLCAIVVRRRRQPTGAEKWAWRIVVPAFVAACACVAAEYWLQWTSLDYGLLDTVFLVTIPVLLVNVLGTTFLGIVLIRRRGVGLPAWLLACHLPAMVVIPMVTSLGSTVLPTAFAFGILGRRIARAESPERVTGPVVASTGA